jgi:hypothetical protein
VGQFCPVATTTPTDCAAGSYRSTTGAESQAQCDTCTTGHYCPIKSVTPTDCQAGSFNTNTGSDDPTDCTVCSTGKYSLDIARTPDCPLCAANSYCPNSTAIKDCPVNTVSVAGSSSLLDCRCSPGFSCSYTKQISAVVTLNASATSFNADVGGVKTAFIAAVAAAAGVPVTSVHIGSVATSSGRRLLAVDESIRVHTTVSGATRLDDLATHLAKHDPMLHLGHSWEESHRLTKTSLLRRPILSSR